MCKGKVLRCCVHVSNRCCFYEMQVFTAAFTEACPDMQVREELSFAITQPIAHPEQYAAMGLGSATGVLLYGPPGCGKTLVAKAIANESGVNFISIKVCTIFVVWQFM